MSVFDWRKQLTPINARPCVPPHNCCEQNGGTTMYKHILIPIDLGDIGAAEQAINHAKHIARRDGSRISVVSIAPAWPPLELRQVPHDYQPDLDAYIATVRDGFDIDSEVKVGGSISGRIIESIVTRKIDLVVMASHNPKLTDYLIGSNAAHVALHAPCSVLVVRAGGQTSMHKKILVPVDLDYPESSAKAMEVATEMSRAEGASLTVISVQPMIIDETGTPPPDYQPKMSAYLTKHGGVPGLLKLGGSIPAEVRYAAAEIGADLIVMGSHDPHFTDYLIGSNAAHVVLHTPCSVLVVR
jgi:nucleotide-binding universal stress UspA family protein